MTKKFENFSNNLFFPKLTWNINKIKSLHTSLLGFPAHRSMNTTDNRALSFITANARNYKKWRLLAFPHITWASLQGFPLGTVGLNLKFAQ